MLQRAASRFFCKIFLSPRQRDLENDGLVPKGGVWAWIQGGLASDAVLSHRKRLVSLGNVVQMCYRAAEALPAVAEHGTEQNLDPLSAGTSDISAVAYIPRWR